MKNMVIFQFAHCQITGGDIPTHEYTQTGNHTDQQTIASLNTLLLTVLPDITVLGQHMCSAIRHNYWIHNDQPWDLEVQDSRGTS